MHITIDLELERGRMRKVMAHNKRLIFLNKEYVTRQDAKISVFDHGFLYGDGIFEGIRAYSGNVFKLKEHLERLYDSAKSIMLTIPYTLEELEQYVIETVQRNHLQDAYIRLVVSRGEGPLGLDPTECHHPNVIIIADEIKMFTPELYENGLAIVTVPTRRNVPDALNPKIKSLNYLNNVLVRLEARQAGVAEALMLNAQGYVAEGSGDNVFIIKKGVIYTPPTYLGALAGITRETIMQLAEEAGYVVKEEPFTRHDVYVADEMFLTGTAAEVIPVIQVDRRMIGTGKPGAITKDLISRYREVVEIDGAKVYKS